MNEGFFSHLALHISTLFNLFFSFFFLEEKQLHCNVLVTPLFESVYMADSNWHLWRRGLPGEIHFLALTFLSAMAKTRECQGLVASSEAASLCSLQKLMLFLEPLFTSMPTLNCA